MFAALKLGAAFFLFRSLSQDAFLLHFATHPVRVSGLFDVIKRYIQQRSDGVDTFGTSDAPAGVVALFIDKHDGHLVDHRFRLNKPLNEGTLRNPFLEVGSVFRPDGFAGRAWGFEGGLLLPLAEQVKHFSHHTDISRRPNSAFGGLQQISCPRKARKSSVTGTLLTCIASTKMYLRGD